jgi:membrane protein
VGRSENLVSGLKRRAHRASAAANRVKVPLTQRLGLVDFFALTWKQVEEDHVGAFAGNLAFHAMFALFPFLVFVLSLLGLFHATGLVDSVINQISPALPGQAVSLLRSVMHSVTKTHASGALTASAVISIVVAMWGVSGGFRAVMEAMNVMYNVKDRRAWWKRYLISIGLATVVTAIMAGALVLVIGGPPIGEAVARRLGAGAGFQWVWNILQWPVLLFFVLLVSATVYTVAPDIEQPFRFATAGALLSVSLWLLFSVLFTLYVNTLATYNRTFGTLAGIAIFLIYLYYSGFIMLLGAEMDQVIEEHARQKLVLGTGGRGDLGPGPAAGRTTGRD